MKSAFKKKHRMQAYAYALGVFQSEDINDKSGVRHPAREFLENVLGYSLDNVFHSEGKYHFPELWEESTVKDLEDFYAPWFNNKQERIEALKNILKIKE